MNKITSLKTWMLTHKKVTTVLAFALVFLIYRAQSGTELEGVQKTTVKQETIKETLTLSGTINADEQTVLTFQTGGMLTAVAVKEGDYVKKGQFIASLDQRDLKKRLQKQLNTYSISRSVFDQTKADYKDVALNDAISRTLDQSQNTLNNSVLDVELTDIAVKYANIYSPIAGIVTSISAPIAGVNVSPATAQFEIINPESIYFASTADQSEVTKLSIGKTGLITLDSFSDNTINSAVSSISFVPKAGETSTVYAIKLPLSEEWNEQYRQGMTGDVLFTMREKKDTLTIPSNYLKEDADGKKYVDVVMKGKRDKKFVKIGIEGDETIEITSGLSKGETIYDFTQ
ncbi:MAG: efflux RND transporter periplasmic adaptor subunit [Microgenomates group bacterium]